MLQLFATMLFSGGLLLALAVIGGTLSGDVAAIRRALRIARTEVAPPPLPRQYRVAQVRSARPTLLPSATMWREAA